MKILRLAFGAAIALLSAHLDAQTPPSAGAIRHAAVRNFALVVKADGSVVGWGREEDGMAARPRSTTGIIASPIAIDLPGKARQVAVGDFSAYALLENGTVVAWGSNYDGQLGNGAPGENGVLGVTRKPSVVPVRVTGLSDVVQIEAGVRHAVALRKDGTVWAWGSRDNASIGDGKPAGLRPLNAVGPVAVRGLANITAIAVGRNHNLALGQDGRVMAWGSNNDGELGNGTRDAVWIPTPVTGLDRVVAIGAGEGGTGHGVSAAVRDDGTVWVWGSNVSAMFGNGEGPLSPDDPGGRNLLPVVVKGVTRAKRVSLGAGHVAAQLADGTLQMWGHDGFGQIGVGTSGFYHERPTKVTALTDVAAVYLGGAHSLAVRTDGALWIWGFGYLGQGILGKNLHVPTRLDLP
jgi:alpha-tubulin suppressor-like RCC1 family protein